MTKERNERAKKHFGELLEAQMERVQRIKASPEWIDYSSLSPIRIGVALR